jgi:hypothetical protein
MQQYKFLITVGLSHLEGKYAPAEELRAQLAEVLDDANPGTITGDNGGEYEVEQWDVHEYLMAPVIK